MAAHLRAAPRARVGSAEWADRVDEHGAAYVGSQLQTQLYVNKRVAQLDAAVRGAFPSPTFDWRSPLADDHYAEYWDAAFLRRLHVDAHVDALAKFWAKRGGPHWDALALVKLPGEPQARRALAEGKSYPDEMLKGSGSAPPTRRRWPPSSRRSLGRRAASASRSTSRLGPGRSTRTRTASRTSTGCAPEA